MTGFVTSLHKDLGNPAPINIHLTLSEMVLFIPSANPFCCGVVTTVLCDTCQNEAFDEQEEEEHEDIEREDMKNK